MLRWMFILGAVALSCSSLASTASVSIDNQLMKGLKLKGDESVIQYGGSNEQRQALTSVVPNGHVIQVQSLQTLSDSRQDNSFMPVDLVFIEEDLTKQNRQQALLQDLSNHLKPSGKMVLHLPDYKQGLIAKVMLDTWLDLDEFVHSAPKFVAHNVKQYQKMLVKSGFKVASGGWHVNVTEFKSGQDMKQWLTDNWAYCQDMEYSEKVLFVSLFVDKYLQESKQNADDPVKFEQCYMDIEAHKLV